MLRIAGTNARSISIANARGRISDVVATGPGAEMRQALGTAVFFGMLGVTFFGLFLTPVFYVSIRILVEVIRSRELSGRSRANRTFNRVEPPQPSGMMRKSVV